MPRRHGAGAAVKAKTSGTNRLAGNELTRKHFFMASTAAPSRDDFAAMLDDMFGGADSFEGRVVHGTVTGIYRRAQAGHGFVRPHAVDGTFKPDVYIREDKGLDAATGDEVLVRVTRAATHIKDAAG